jgi:hypothetical protein
MKKARARLVQIAQEIQQAGQLWASALETVATSYAQAYRNHVQHLPPGLPPQEHTVLIGAIVGAVTGVGVGVVLNPRTAGRVIAPLRRAIESLATVEGGRRSVEEVSAPLCDTPLKYQNVFPHFLQTQLTAMVERIDQLKDGAGPREKSPRGAAADEIDCLEQQFDSSPLRYPPRDHANWNEEGKLDAAMEKSMWAAWAIRLRNVKRLKEAAQADLGKTLKRLQNPPMSVVSPKLSARGDDPDRMSAAIRILRWAMSYRPREKFGSRMPKPAQQFARDLLNRSEDSGPLLPLTSSLRRRTASPEPGR